MKFLLKVIDREMTFYGIFLCYVDIFWIFANIYYNEE